MPPMPFPVTQPPPKSAAVPPVQDEPPRETYREFVERLDALGKLCESDPEKHTVNLTGMTREELIAHFRAIPSE